MVEQNKEDLLLILNNQKLFKQLLDDQQRLINFIYNFNACKELWRKDTIELPDYIEKLLQEKLIQTSNRTASFSFFSGPDIRWTSNKIQKLDAKQQQLFEDILRMMLSSSDPNTKTKKLTKRLEQFKNDCYLLDDSLSQRKIIFQALIAAIIISAILAALSFAPTHIPHLVGGLAVSLGVVAAGYALAAYSNYDDRLARIEMEGWGQEVKNYTKTVTEEVTSRTRTRHITLCDTDFNIAIRL